MMLRAARGLHRRRDDRSGTGCAPLARVVAVLGVLGCLFLWTGRAAAGDQYKELVQSALAEYEAGNWEESAALFEQAHAMSPSARTSRGLGIAYFEARKYALAVPHLRAALSDNRRPLTGAQREGVQRTLRRAEAFVARYRLALEPAGVSLEVDSRPATLADGELLLDPGQHQLIASATGYLPERRMLEAVAGSAGELGLRLRREGEAVVPPPMAASEAAPVKPQLQPSTADGAYLPPAAVSSRTSFPVAPMIATGVGVAALGAAVVTGIMVQNQKTKLERECVGSVDCTSGVDKGNRLELATNVLLISGAVVTVAGATWWLIAAGAFAGAREPPAEAASPQLSALCLPQLCAATLRGAF